MVKGKKGNISSHDNIVPTAKLRKLLHPEVNLVRVKHLLLAISEI